MESVSKVAEEGPNNLCGSVRGRLCRIWSKHFGKSVSIIGLRVLCTASVYAEIQNLQDVKVASSVQLNKDTCLIMSGRKTCLNCEWEYIES